MTLQQFLDTHPDLQVPEDVLAYARFLDASGMKFLIDYGYENCKNLAIAEMNKQLMDRTQIQ